MRNQRQERQTDISLRLRTRSHSLWYHLHYPGENQSEDDSEGAYKIREILSDDLNDMIIDEVKATEKNKTADLMKKWIKKNAKAKII